MDTSCRKIRQAFGALQQMPRHPAALPPYSVKELRPVALRPTLSNGLPLRVITISREQVEPPSILKAIYMPGNTGITSFFFQIESTSHIQRGMTGYWIIVRMEMLYFLSDRACMILHTV
jgi:hypothetical protein